MSPVTVKLSHLFQRLWPMRHLLHNRGWIGGKHLSSCQMHLFYLSYFNAYSYSYWVFITQHNQSQDIKNYDIFIMVVYLNYSFYLLMLWSLIQYFYMKAIVIIYLTRLQLLYVLTDIMPPWQNIGISKCISSPLCLV